MKRAAPAIAAVVAVGAALTVAVLRPTPAPPQTAIATTEQQHEQPSVSEPPVTGTTEKEGANGDVHRVSPTITTGASGDLYSGDDVGGAAPHALLPSSREIARQTGTAEVARPAGMFVDPASGVEKRLVKSSQTQAQINYPTWDSCTSIVIPPDHFAIAPQRGMRITIDDQLKSDTNISLKWAQDADAACNCHGYDWLKCNGAAYRDWHDHAAGEDPITYFCKQGYDSPLATYNERFSLNRDQLGLSVVEVWFNAKRYEGRILPVDCLAGCTVYADLPCEAPRQATVITLREPTEEQYGACFTYSADGRARMKMRRCPPRYVK